MDYIEIAVYGLALLAIFLLILYLKTIRSKEPYDEQLNYANAIIYLAGFSYDPQQNMFITRQDALQRIGGYNSFYDYLSTLLYMPIDIEPIKFSYKGLNYMIELWKGQYFASTGCEIGIYVETSQPGRYRCASDDQMLDMSYVLMKDDGKGNKTEIFRRSGIHWWLTGFKPGVCSDPTNLSMENITIKFTDPGMAKAFYDSASKYFGNVKEYNYSIASDIVKFRWQKTIADQPNKAARTMYLEYDCKLAAQTKLIMKDNYNPRNINKIIDQTRQFLEYGDNFYDFVDFWTQGKDIDALAIKWDKDHGTAIIDVVNFMKFLKGRVSYQADLIQKILKAFCFLFPSSAICQFAK